MSEDSRIAGTWPTVSTLIECVNFGWRYSLPAANLPGYAFNWLRQTLRLTHQYPDVAWRGSNGERSGPVYGRPQRSPRHSTFHQPSSFRSALMMAFVIRTETPEFLKGARHVVNPSRNVTTLVIRFNCTLDVFLWYTHIRSRDQEMSNERRNRTREERRQSRHHHAVEGVGKGAKASSSNLRRRASDSFAFDSNRPQGAWASAGRLGDLNLGGRHGGAA